LKTVLYAIFILAIILLRPASAGTTIRFSAGPDGETKISTPWGDYASIVRGDSVWVGTAAEFEHNRVVGIMKENGARPFRPDGKKQEVFITSAAPEIQVGNTQVAGINIVILFNTEEIKTVRRPKKPSNSEFVSVLWFQDSDIKINPMFFDAVSGKSFSPYNCLAPEGMHVCEFIVKSDSLTHPISLVFLSPKQKPGVFKLDSLSHEHYAAFLLRRKMFKGSPLEDEDLKELISLRRIDPSIPEEVPYAPGNVNLKIEICGQDAAQMLDDNQLIAYPIEFRIQGRRYDVNNNATIYAMDKAPNRIRNKPSCMAGTAKLKSNIVNDAPPSPGDFLIVESATKTNKQTGQNLQFTFKAMIMEVTPESGNTSRLPQQCEPGNRDLQPGCCSNTGQQPTHCLPVQIQDSETSLRFQ
jgi:hypothetical protein